MIDPHPRTLRRFLALSALPFLLSPVTQASAQPQDAKSIVAAAVQTELNADRTDHTAYIYRDHDITPDHDTLFFVVETPQGNLKRKLEDHDRPLTPQQRQADEAAIHALVSDPALQARQRKDNANDDQQAEQMLKLLPEAYLWTVVGEQGDLVTLDFKPDPAFQPRNLEARVLSSMAGQIVVARADNRIRTIRGALVDDVKFGYGVLGRLKKGGSFQVERRELAPHHWQVVESHTKIEGRALFFKTIGTIEDEVRTEFKPSPAQTHQQAREIRQQPRE